MSTLASDDFNRANANPIDGNWATAPGFSAFKLQTNAATAASANDTADRNTGATWPNDQWAQLTIATVVSYTFSGDGDGPMVRCATAGTTKIDYELVVGSGGAGCAINRRTGAGFATIATSATTFANGDVAYLEVQGTTISAKKNGSTFGLSTTDSNIASGAAGMAHSDEGTGAGSLDDWSGGDFAGAATKAPPIFAAQRGPRFIRSRKVI